MQLKTVIVIVAAVLSVALGVLTQWLQPGPYLTGGVLIALLGYGVYVFHPVVRRSPRYDPVPPKRRGSISRWIFVGGLPYVAWVVVVAVGVDWKGWIGLLVGLPLISWLVWVAATGVQVLRLSGYDGTGRKATLRARWKAWRSRRLPAVVPTATQVLADESMMLKRARQMMKEVLELTGDYAYLVVEQPYKASPHCLVVPVRVPSRVAAQLAQQEADERNGVTSSSKSVATFGPSSATTVAIALSEKTSTPIPTGWVTVEPTGYEGVFKIIVMSRDVMADVHVWYDDPTPTTSYEPTLVSYFRDGTENRMDLTGNGLIAAMSQAGKTNILMLLLLFYLLCTDAVVWVGGVRKQFETYWPLIAKYMGTKYRMPLDLLVTGQNDTAQLVLAALNLVDYRNGLKDKSGLKRVKIFIDEYTDVAENKKVLFFYKKVWMDVPTGVRMLNRVGKSVYVEAVLATHRDTNSTLGTEGGDLKSGMDWTICLRTNELASIHRLFGDYSLERLVHPGEVYAARTGVRPRRSKAPYVQEVGKPNAPKTNGPTVTEAGWARRHLVAERQLTPAEQQACGEFYLNRHTHVTPELEEYLRYGPIETAEEAPAEQSHEALSAGPASVSITGGPDAAAEAGRRRAEELIARQEAEWAAAEAAQAQQPTTTPSTPDTPVVVSSLDNARHRKGRPAAILRLLAEGPMTVATLIERMRAEGDATANRPLIYNALSKLRDEKLIESEEVDGEVIHQLVGAA